MTRPPPAPTLQNGRQGRGRAQPGQLGRLRRGRHRLRAEVRLGDALREADRLPGQRQGGRHLRRDGQADADRPVRRRLGLRQRDRPPRRRRRRGPGQRRPGPELRGRLPRSQGPAVQHVRRRPLRHPARPRGEPADVEHGRREARADVVGRDARPGQGGAVQAARSAPTTTRSTSPTRPCI